MAKLLLRSSHPRMVRKQEQASGPSYLSKTIVLMK
jgi:hypothetical protein